MTKKLLENILWMTASIMLGVFNFNVALRAINIWLFILNMGVALWLFFLAYIAYRRARKIAEILDAPTEIKISIERLMPDAPQSETKEHEDIGEPI